MSVRALAAIGLLCVMARGAGAAPGKIDQVLQGTVTVSADRAGLKAVFEKLAARAEGMNLVVNWAALKEVGVTRETGVSLRLRGVTLEAGIRAIIEAVGPGKLNYSVGDGVVEVTTNAEIGKTAATRFYDLKGVLKAPVGFVVGKQAGSEQQVLWGIFASELMRVGERVEVEGAEGRGLKIDGNVMAVTTSARGQAAIQHALFLLGNAARPGTYPPGSAVSVAARKGEEGWKKLLAGTTVAAVVGDLSGAERAGVSVVVGPGTVEELKKGSPSEGGISSVIDFSGVVIVGPSAVVREPVMMGVFDVRELLKRLAVRSGKAGAVAGDFADVVVEGVKGKVAGAWGEMGKAEMAAGAYHGEMVVFAPPSMVRETSLVLQDMMK